MPAHASAQQCVVARLAVGRKNRNATWGAEWSLRSVWQPEGDAKPSVKLLGARFGALPGQVVAEVKAADLDQLDLWAERVLTAATLADALNDA